MGPVKEFRQRSAFFVPSSCFFVRSQARFFVPTRASLRPARAGAVKVGRRANLSACSALARPHLYSSEHDGAIDAVGDDDQRGARFLGGDL
jgi:hypothetical protein